MLIFVIVCLSNDPKLRGDTQQRSNIFRSHFSVWVHKFLHVRVICIESLSERQRWQVPIGVGAARGFLLPPFIPPSVKFRCVSRLDLFKYANRWRNRFRGKSIAMMIRLGASRDPARALQSERALRESQSFDECPEEGGEEII